MKKLTKGIAMTAQFYIQHVKLAIKCQRNPQKVRWKHLNKFSSWKSKSQISVQWECNIMIFISFIFFLYFQKQTFQFLIK